MKYNFIIFFAFIILVGCQKENTGGTWVKSDYTGTFKNIVYSEQLVHTFTTGIYHENEIPDDIKNLAYGRVEIDFHYNSGALTYFSPLFYYGSQNKNTNDDTKEEPKFHMAVEIGHYNVIPSPVEHLFYTISTFRQPQYCRDTYCPLVPGVNYTMVIDKRPEGIILQLRKGDIIANIFPHAFFPDSSQMFFNDVTNYVDRNKGDSLQKVLMVGKGFAGFEEGIHELRGEVSALRVFKYDLVTSSPEYEFQYIRNQHAENQEVSFRVKDNLQGADKFIVVRHEFWPYKFESGELTSIGTKQTGESEMIPNTGELLNYTIRAKEVGFYKLYLKTIDKNGDTITSSIQPFDIWVYPKEWNFEFYKL